jgi:hypothetical protein
MPHSFVRSLAALLFAAACAPPALAALPDEIQIYTDDINEPGEFGLELHVNTTPRGISAPDYPGESVADRGLRITPEFSYGITRTLEAGLYVPMVMKAGNWSFTGLKPRLKWLPIKGDEVEGGWYAGVNLEISNNQPKFTPSRHNAELRIMLGHRSKDWLIGVNPVFGWALSPSQLDPKPVNPDFSFNTRITRRVGDGIVTGFEYYNSKGTWRQFDPSSQQGKTLFWIVEVENKVLPFQVGIGRGLNDATDRWTIKAIFDVAL